MVFNCLFLQEVKGAGAGLTAAALIVMVPSHISCAVALSYDNETLNTGSLFYATLTAIAYFYMVVLGTLLAALVPVVGFNAVMTSEHFASFLTSSY
ncbi:hypothetical protein C1H46_024508 [Malus baccata]|uniref:dolichyl-diphosphooligosaccharide--protein glycotransferase n=1 Tax=Malus baccata TaxID=106549 RepID=A0A540LTW5_MALBA|nr:hypothetical protein C1H46_024508 [Malus baccata]